MTFFKGFLLGMAAGGSGLLTAAGADMLAPKLKLTGTMRQVATAGTGVVVAGIVGGVGFGMLQK